MMIKRTQSGGNVPKKSGKKGILCSQNCLLISFLFVLVAIPLLLVHFSVTIDLEPAKWFHIANKYAIQEIQAYTTPSTPHPTIRPSHVETFPDSFYEDVERQDGTGSEFYNQDDSPENESDEGEVEDPKNEENGEREETKENEEEDDENHGAEEDGYSEEDESKKQNSAQRLQADSALEQSNVIEGIENALKLHPFSSLTTEQKNTFLLEDYFVYLSEQPLCKNLPIFTSMANIFSELYWQLIENFVYSMVKFGLSNCAVMVCVSDLNCMKRCQNSYFPCILYDYQKIHPDKALPSALEQIAELKLFHLPKALQRGVNVIILDSDVGFLSSPLKLIELIDPSVDMYVQKDIAYVMNRTLEGWKTWYTTPLPNIGIFYIKGNEKTVYVFQHAWERYKNVDTKRRNNPGKDQNQVAIAMRIAEMSKGLKWRFFPASTAVLLDMMYKFNDPRYELGGTAALSLLQPSNKTNAMSKRHKMGEKTKDVGQVSDPVHAVHTTCYEQKNKVNGLKTTNAFWNPYYYNVSRPTLTKKIIYVSDDQLRNEVRTLLYLGYITNRSVIIPNLLSATKVMHNPLDLYQNQSIWPWFRILYYKQSLSLPTTLSVIEPSYYWRIERDYFMNKGNLIPRPYIIPFYNFLNKRNYPSKDFQQYQTNFNKDDPNHAVNPLTVRDIEEKLLSPSIRKMSRVVLNVLPFIYKIDSAKTTQLNHRLFNWAMDSVGKFADYETELGEYELLPKLIGKSSAGLRGDSNYCGDCRYPKIAEPLVKETRLCDVLYRFDNGNRSCFNKCH